MKDKNILLHGDQLEAYIIPSSDSHGNEYLNEKNEKDKRRAFITKFTGFISDRKEFLI